MRRPAPDTDATELYVYSEEDIADIASDMYVDLREVMDDDQAAEAVDVCFGRLTDGFHSHK